MGEALNFNRLARVPPLKVAAGGPGPESGRPQRGGIESPSFTSDQAGLRGMQYSYKGDVFFSNTRILTRPGDLIL